MIEANLNQFMAGLLVGSAILLFLSGMEESQMRRKRIVEARVAKALAKWLRGGWK